MAAAPGSNNDDDKREPATIVIAGGGIVGLVFAMALKKHTGITCEIYEKASRFYDDVGAALGMYPNGLRVIRDIDPRLLKDIQNAGAPYVYRRWERHDGTEIAAAKEDELTEGDWELSSIGIRRWKLQKVLYQAALAMGIPFSFSKGTQDVIVDDESNGGLITVVFEDGTTRQTQILFGCDGAHSGVRNAVAANATTLEYTGVTCLMGMSNCPARIQGISFPTSPTTGCHAVYFPTGPDEQCFQIHWPIPTESANSQNWGNLTDLMTQTECRDLAERLQQDGWHERFIEPLRHVTHAVRVGFALMKPRLTSWAYGSHDKNKCRVVLMGDAAHPPVPYIGQGAQMGIEDAGTMVWLLKRLCMDYEGTFQLQNFHKAVQIYEKLRIPRTSQVLDCSKQLGQMQDMRKDANLQEEIELLIQGELMMNGTLPIMFQGSGHHYREAVEKEVELLYEQEERIAMEQYMPGLYEITEVDRKRKELQNQEELRAAFEVMLYGG